MKIKELIEILKDIPDETDIIVPDELSDKIDSVKQKEKDIIKAYKNILLFVINEKEVDYNETTDYCYYDENKKNYILQYGEYTYLIVRKPIEIGIDKNIITKGIWLLPKDSQITGITQKCFNGDISKKNYDVLANYIRIDIDKSCKIKLQLHAKISLKQKPLLFKIPFIKKLFFKISNILIFFSLWIIILDKMFKKYPSIDEDNM